MRSLEQGAENVRSDDERLWAGGLEILQVLAGGGYEAYLVGGCVRDRLLGRPLGDIDIAASAHPEEVAALFERTIPTGLHHGTVTVLHAGNTYEVTTFRTESGYSDARRPDKVAFVLDIREDLARRDFTINAMAIGLNGEWIDLYGGRQDLTQQVIRCVGDPLLRFSEDALRMVRAIRFAAALDFRFAKSVWRGIRTQAPRLERVAMERIGAEWDKMMAGPHPARACEMLMRSGLLTCLKEPLPTVIAHSSRECDDRDGETSWLHKLELDKLADPDVRWMAFLTAARCSPEEAADACRSLRISGKRVSRITAGLAFHQRMTNRATNDANAWDHAGFVIAVLDLGRPAALDWTAMLGSMAGNCREWLEELAVYSFGQLAVRGDELAVHLNRKPGPWVAKRLRGLLEDVVLARVPNEKDALLAAALDYDEP